MSQCEHIFSTLSRADLGIAYHDDQLNKAIDQRSNVLLERLNRLLLSTVGWERRKVAARLARASDWLRSITARDASRRFLSVVTIPFAGIDLVPVSIDNG